MGFEVTFAGGTPPATLWHLPVGGRLRLDNLLLCVAVMFTIWLLFVWTVREAGPYEVSLVRSGCTECPPTRVDV